MVDDKYSKDWKTSKNGETYSMFADIQEEQSELLNVARDNVAKKIKEPIAYDGYYFVPVSFPDKNKKDDSGKPLQVEMLFRYVSKEKAEEKANNSGKGGNYQSKKDYLITWTDISFIDLNDEKLKQKMRDSGYVPGTAALLGDKAITMDGDGHLLEGFIRPVKIEVREEVQNK